MRIFLSCATLERKSFPNETIKRHRSRDAVGIRGMRQVARQWNETSTFERSWREAGGGVRPFIPIQARKAKKETRKKKRKKEGGTPADA
jgi:hypothetical protein